VSESYRMLRPFLDVAVKKFSDKFYSKFEMYEVSCLYMLEHYEFPQTELTNLLKLSCCYSRPKMVYMLLNVMPIGNELEEITEAFGDIRDEETLQSFIAHPRVTDEMTEQLEQWVIDRFVCGYRSHTLLILINKAHLFVEIIEKVHNLYYLALPMTCVDEMWQTKRGKRALMRCFPILSGEIKFNIFCRLKKRERASLHRDMLPALRDTNILKAILANDDLLLEFFHLIVEEGNNQIADPVDDPFNYSITYTCLKRRRLKFFEYFNEVQFLNGLLELRLFVKLRRIMNRIGVRYVVQLSGGDAGQFLRTVVGRIRSITPKYPLGTSRKSGYPHEIQLKISKENEESLCKIIEYVYREYPTINILQDLVDHDIASFSTKIVETAHKFHNKTDVKFDTNDTKQDEKEHFSFVGLCILICIVIYEIVVCAMN